MPDYSDSHNNSDRHCDNDMPLDEPIVIHSAQASGDFADDASATQVSPGSAAAKAIAAMSLQPVSGPIDAEFVQRFGTAQERVERALASLRVGHGFLLLDDQDRENEGDLIFSAEHLTVAQMNLLIRDCSGIVCLCLEDSAADRLKLAPMVENNCSRNQTAFTVSIEAREGVSTGVSAADRVHTILVASSAQCTADDLLRPGHVFPLRARPGGLLERRGHTEGTVDMMKLAGLAPFGVLCELMNDDGTMARLPEVIAYALTHELPVLTIEDIVQYRKNFTPGVVS